MVMTAIRTVIAAVTAMIFPRIELGKNFFIIRMSSSLCRFLYTKLDYLL